MPGPGDQDIDVRLFAGLEARTRDGVRHLRLPLSDAPTLAALLERLGLPAGGAGLRLVNGVHAAPEAVLQPGDEISLFPPLGGG
jgi:sulfur-carrier protein